MCDMRKDATRENTKHPTTQTKLTEEKELIRILLKCDSICM